ncbi:MAG TPA: hypothetical protein PKA04_05840 [Marmoricola sp.]|nr:hypothetical protein [Marmoricola sp.]
MAIFATGSSKARWAVGLAILVAFWLLGPWVLLFSFVSLFSERVRGFLAPRFKGRLALVTTLALVIGVLAILVAPSGRFPIISGPGVLVGADYVGRPAQARPIRIAVEANPSLAGPGHTPRNADAGATNTVPWSGPLGEQPVVESTTYGARQCGRISIARDGGLLATCVSALGAHLVSLDPKPLRVQDSWKLPDRPNGGVNPFANACTGANFYLDNHDRVVLATADRKLHRLTTSGGFKDDRTFDLRAVIAARDCLLSALPDWSGRIWFLTREGTVGFMDQATGRVSSRRLAGESLTELTTDPNGAVYAATTHYIYQLKATKLVGKRAVGIGWRYLLPKGAAVRVGGVSVATPSALVVLPSGEIGYADHESDRLRVVFLRASDGREICSAPVFEAGRGATSTPMAVVGNGVLVTNNAGYSGPWRTLLGRTTTPGVARVDLADGHCEVKWTNDELSAPSAAPKVSLVTGLAYFVTKPHSWAGIDAWYFTAVEVSSGRVAYRVRLGSGPQFTQHHSAVYLGPDGSAYLPVMTGIVKVSDRS